MDHYLRFLSDFLPVNSSPLRGVLCLLKTQLFANDFLPQESAHGKQLIELSITQPRSSENMNILDQVSDIQGFDAFEADYKIQARY